jgi:hypothetical protein
MTPEELFATNKIFLQSTASGRYYTTCPRCSRDRHGGDHQKAKVLGVTIDGNTVHWGCNHCGWKGPEKGSNGGTREGGEFATTYDYRDAGGVPRFQKLRCPPGSKNRFFLRRPNGHGGWINGTKGVDTTLLYRIDEVNEAIALGRKVALVEGEKDVDNLWAIGIPATCNAHGASEPGKAPKWTRKHSEQLRGADIVVFNDNDAAGYEHAEATCRLSNGIAAHICRLDLAQHWPGMPKGADVSDWFQLGHTREELDALIEVARDWESAAAAPEEPEPKPNGANSTESHSGKESTWRDHAISVRDLCDKKFPDVRFVIPGLIPEGVTLLVSRPKLGKSWLLQQLASSVALGAPTLVSEPPVPGDVLHLTLEDGERRFQRRMKKYFGANRSTWPARMTMAAKWRPLDKGGIDDMREWCKSVSNPTLITVDTLKKVRPATKAKDTNYASDYEANELLVALCHEFPGLAIVVAHHDRKMDADDPFDTVSGTLGLTGGVDAIALLKRHRQGITLHIQGRDLLDNVEKAVNFDRKTGRWMILGEAGEVHRSKDERAIIEALRAAPDGLRVQAIMDETGLRPRNKVDQMLGRMLKSGAIERRKRGVYAIIPDH